MTGDDILKLASDLFTRSASPSEALCRNIVGRSYYGAFHVALAFLANLGVRESELSGHKAPVRWLTGSGEPNAKKAGYLLDDLYAARHRADYKLNLPRAITESRNLQFVRGQVEMASDVRSLLQSCDIEPVRSQVLRGIQASRQRQPGKRGTQ